MSKYPRYPRGVKDDYWFVKEVLDLIDRLPKWAVAVIIIIVIIAIIRL